MAESARAPASQVEVASGSSKQQKTALEQAASSAPPGSGSDAPPANTVSGFIFGVQMAHYDFCMWFFKPHGAVYDAQMAALIDNNGLRREYVGYGLLALTLLLLCTPAAPLVANLVCVLYPLWATFQILRGNDNQVESTRYLTYWAFFAVLSICDYKFGPISTLYWLLKVVTCVYLYLPQTQGAVVVYAGLIRPILDFVDTTIAPKLA